MKPAKTGESRRERRAAWRRAQRPAPPSAESRLAVLISELTAQAEAGQQYVLIGHVLRIAGASVPPGPAPDPRADPLLGTLPVTPD